MPDVINRREETVGIDTIEPHPANPNDGDVQAIRESIRQIGFYGRLIVRESTAKILAGEHTWRAAQKEGMTEIPVEWVECDDDTAMRLLLADNATAEKAVREPEPLADLLQHLESTPDGLDGTGYMGDDLDELLDDLGRIPGNGADELSEPPLEEKALEDVKILNLYAGIGGNRKLWGDEPDVTSVEWNEEIAGAYEDHFPDDTVIVDDAHEYLLNHFDEFDFIWSSPPCPTHSKLRKNIRYEVGENSGNDLSKIDPVYPDMSLYEEILFLENYFDGVYCVENVEPYYEPLIKPQKSHRHYFWANFDIPSVDLPTSDIRVGDVQKLQSLYGYDLSEYQFSDDYPKDKILKNCIHPKLGKAILESALNNSE